MSGCWRDQDERWRDGVRDGLGERPTDEVGLYVGRSRVEIERKEGREIEAK
jgi:hypothetical protein